LGIYVVAAIAANLDRALPIRRQLMRIGLILAGLGAGIYLYEAHDLYKFPLGTKETHAALLERYLQPWPGNPGVALAALTLSLGTGVFFYCPTLIASFYGLARCIRREKVYCGALVLASLIFFLFISSLSFYKGDPCWGPRYLTPAFGLLWVFVPQAVPRLGRRCVAMLAVLGLTVQLLGLAVDPHRLYIERGLPSAFYTVRPFLYFHPAVAHLTNRPREIIDILRNGERAEAFTPARSPTFALPIIDFVKEKGPEGVRKYHVLNSLRPWWASFRYLSPGERPVNLGTTWAILVTLAFVGLAFMAPCLRQDRSVGPVGDAGCRGGVGVEDS